MRFFSFLARNISYTFAVAFFVSMATWLESAICYAIASSFVLSSYDKILRLFIQWLPLFLMALTVIFYIIYGFLSPAGIPALMSRHRVLNKVYRNKLEFEAKDGPEVYGDFSDLVMNTTTIAAFFAVFVGLSMAGMGFYKYYISGELTILEFKYVIKMTVLATIILVLVLCMTVHLMTEYMTNNARASIYNEILKNGLLIRPHSLINVSVNFIFFVIIMMIILFSFGAMLTRMRTVEQGQGQLIIIFLVVAVLGVLYFARVNAFSILRILTDMSRVTREIASGSRAGFNVLSLGKEFSSIEYALMEMAWEIDEHRKNLELKVQERTEELEKVMNSLKLRDEQIQKQLDMASVIQRSILPTRIDDWNELKFSVRYNAMEKIGGDFYDVFQLKDNKIGIMMSDVSGHGIPAALITAMAKISFGNAGSLHESPRRIFQEVNKTIIDHMKTQDYLTCFMVAIDDDYNVTYSNASHQKAILMRGATGEIEYLDTNGLFIGALEEARDTYEEKVTKLEYGDRLILYTDGIPEAQNNARQEYSHERLEKNIKRNNELHGDDFADAILDDVKDFTGEIGAIDDISLLVIELVWDDAIDVVKDAKRLINSHKYLEAIEILENGLEKYPDNMKILYNLGKNYFRVNNFSKSIKTMNEYLQRDTRNKFAFYICGASHYQMMDFRSAAEQLNLALALDPNMANALFALAMSYKNMSEYDLAIQTFEKVLNIESDNKMALFEIRQIEKLKADVS
ncbi:MAG TPA: SpoIIE family protein phosphatase [Spirochaetota bacterium]|nr:SpoIIE family protein phosphatase [Spirochaetota bacterium]